MMSLIVINQKIYQILNQIEMILEGSDSEIFRKFVLVFSSLVMSDFTLTTASQKRTNQIAQFLWRHHSPGEQTQC